MPSFIARYSLKLSFKTYGIKTYSKTWVPKIWFQYMSLKKHSLCCVHHTASVIYSPWRESPKTINARRILTKPSAACITLLLIAAPSGCKKSASDAEFTNVNKFKRITFLHRKNLPKSDILFPHLILTSNLYDSNFSSSMCCMEKRIFWWDSEPRLFFHKQKCWSWCRTWQPKRRCNSCCKGGNCSNNSTVSSSLVLLCPFGSKNLQMVIHWAKKPHKLQWFRFINHSNRRILPDPNLRFHKTLWVKPLDTNPKSMRDSKFWMKRDHLSLSR